MRGSRFRVAAGFRLRILRVARRVVSKMRGLKADGESLLKAAEARIEKFAFSRDGKVGTEPLDA